MTQEQKQKTPTATDADGSIAHQWKHGEVKDLPLRQIEPNDWNPNVMTPRELDMLAENIEDVDFLDPLLVVPIDIREGVQMYRIVDGAHRYEVERLKDVEMLPCVIADPEKFDENKQKFQSVRMNKIKGSLDSKKFSKLVNDLMQSGEYSFEQLAHEFGFVDDDEFQSLLESTRESLPDDLKEKFDDAKGEIKTVEDLSLLLNRLFTQYGDTLPANFMIMDFGGKDHIWVRMKRAEFQKSTAIAKECMAYGITFDSVITRVLSLMDVGKFISKHRDFLEEIPEDAASRGEVETIDELLA